jgi:aromatic-amino-acid transaminase
MFETLAPPSVEALMEIGRLFGADPRVDKLDLGIGVYRNEQRLIPIMSVVKKAEARILIAQTSKGYLGPEGDPLFAERLQTATLDELGAAGDGRLVGIQAAGGTGALWLALELVARTRPLTRVWLGLPTWPIRHAPERRGRIRSCPGRPDRTGPQKWAPLCN